MRMVRLQKRAARNSAYYIVIASEAKQSIWPQAEEWIASSLLLLAMTEKRKAGIAPGPSSLDRPVKPDDDGGANP
jgi:hypothetical protein